MLISIDEHEQAQLKLLCDEILNEKNFIGCFIVNAAPNGRDYGAMAKQHEYCLLYAKDVNEMNYNLMFDSSKKFKYKDDISEFNIHPLYNSNVEFTPKNRPNLYYPFYINPSTDDDGFCELSLEKKEGWIEVYPPISKKEDAQFVWRWGKAKALKNLNKEIIGYKSKEGYRVVQKMRHTHKLIRSLLTDKAYSTRKGTADLEEIFGSKVLKYPKPVQLIKTLLKMSTQDNSIVLDFFAGSGTTAQAVLELNQEDGGERKFILCNNNENKICEELTYQRAKTVITGKRKDRSKYSDGIPANLKYYKIKYVSKDEEYLSDELNKHIKEMVQLEHGIDVNDFNYCLVLSDKDADELEKNIDNMKELYGIYISKDVLLTSSQKKRFSDIDTYIIPDYYFDMELKERGE